MIDSPKKNVNDYLETLASKVVKYFAAEHPLPRSLEQVKEIDFSQADAHAIGEYLADKPNLQEKLSDLVDYTPNRWLLTQEIPVVRARRKIHDIPDTDYNPKSGDSYEWARKNHLQGICFSGGGIRSATFNLGVLQGLAKLGILSHFDYLSSVSGGGYIHEWLAGWIKREEQEFQERAEETVAAYHPGDGFKTVEKQLIPLPFDRDNSVHPAPIRWLRRYSNYLTPQKGLFTADTWVAIAIWLRNTFLNQLILVSGLFVLLLIPYLVAKTITKLSATCSTLAAGVLFLIAVTSIAVALRREYSRIRFLDDHPEAHQPEEHQNFGGEKTILAFVIVPLFLASLLHLTSVLSLGHGLAGEDSKTELVWLFVLLWSLVAATALAGATTETYRALHGLGERPVGLWRRVWRILHIATNGIGLLVVANAAVSAFAGTLFFMAVRWSLGWHLAAWIAKATGDPEPWRFHVAFGPPLLFAVPFFTLVIGAGLVGRDFHDWLREWLARVRAWALLFGLGWAIFFGIALLGPFFLNWQATEYLKLTKTVKWSAVIIWIAGTVSSVLAGKSNKTSGETGEGASRSLPLDKLAKLGSYGFVLGLLLLLSLVSRSAFDYVTSTNSKAMLAVLIATPLAIFLLFGWRVDVNDFSMNPFYRNRLTRCYLGAVNPTRVPNPLTGFDDRDTRGMQISRLTPADGYTGPLPIICTAINLSFGEDLAWQERKAASFAFTPLYSGYHVGWTAGKRGRALSFNGFVPTFKYAFPDGGINIATAVSISGAAASPNWGYHTDPATAFLMTMFNVRLGWWLFNTRRSKLAGAPLDTVSDQPEWPSPRFSPLELTKELLGMADDTSKYVYLSDGGHFDNMGLYELVRRRCYRIVICDAEQDESYFFEGIANAIRKCRIDFGVEITLEDLDLLRPNALTGNCKSHWALGKIRYPETPPNQEGQQPYEGKILYIKSSLTGAATYEDILLPSEPVDVVNFKFTHEHFPHDTTANQWFTESQFESYRRLGYHVTDEIFRCAQWTGF